MQPNLIVPNRILVKDFYAFAIVCCLFNPPFGIAALICSWQVRKASKENKYNKARILSDTTFALAFIGIIITILVIVMLYAYRVFPKYTSTYYNRDDLLENLGKAAPTPNLNATTPAPM